MKSLFLELLHAKSEEQVHTILKKHPLTSNPQNWVPYGDSLGNYSSFDNQMTTAEAALIEKLTNSIDAILTRQCLIKGINPSSKKAPQSMQEALSTLFTPDEKNQEYVQVIVDGAANEPNLMILDDGEGQEYTAFPNTFLSLQNGNKNNIKFVQGQFNMGSTGAVVFCGKYKYQLIASRRHPSLNSNSQDIGFTIVRKHVRTADEREKLKNTWYEYFVVDGEVPHFESDEISVLPEQNIPFTHGSIVKMYNYQLTRKSIAYKSLRTDIDNLLYYPAFPIKVYESRDAYKSSDIANWAYGNGNILKGSKESVKEALEWTSVGEVISNPLFGTVSVDLYLFKEEEKQKAASFAGKKPIVFLMNGQVQYGLPTSFISKDLNLKLIKNHLIVSIDCTNMKREFMDEGFFQANRESIRRNEQTNKFMDLLTRHLATHQDLINYNKKRASVKISSQATKQLFERLLGKNKKDQLLKNLFKSSSFGSHSRYNDHINKWEKDSVAKEWVEFPTYFKISNAKQTESNEYVKAVEMGKTFQIKMETDVEPFYFERDEDKGEIEFSFTKNRDGFNNEDKDVLNPSNHTKNEDVQEEFPYTRSFSNGILSLTFGLPEKEISVGDVLKLNLNIHDEQGHEFNHIISVEVKAPSTKDESKPKKKRESLNLPSLIQVFKDQEEIEKQERSEEEKNSFQTWADVNWDEEDAKDRLVEIRPNDDSGVGAILINMNSGILKQIVEEEGTAGTKLAFAQEQFLTNVYTQGFLLGTAIQKLEEQSKKDGRFQIEDAEVLAEEIVKTIAYASVKLSINTIQSYSKED